MDKPRLMGRVGGTSSLPAYAITTKDADGPELERVDKDAEESFARGADELSKALRERGLFVRKREERERRLRVLMKRHADRPGVAKMGSVKACLRALKRDKKRIDEVGAKIGRLEAERRKR